ncbi:MAG: 4Fe-4S binding protein [Clostridia bacterium]|nr:4Fe-4S binding protein [Clostridia bacterium]
MSKTWYPVLNYEVCIECGACLDKCKHGVYEKEASRPVVVSPEGCVQGCHGCGNLCPVGAIEYVGDNTGWTAPGKQSGGEGNSGCCDSSGCCG